MQMPQQGMVSNQQAMPGMQQQIGGNMMQPALGTVAPQMGGMGQPLQIPPTRHQQQPTMLMKTEFNTGQSQGMPMMQQRMPAPTQTQQQETPSTSAQATTQDPIVRFKQLLPQLKEALNTLILVARQNFIANATIDNLEKSVDTSLLPHFDKALERFYMICNQIQANLSLASDQISQTLFSMQQAPLTTNQMKDSINPQVYSNYIMTVKQQLLYAKEIQNMLIDSSNKARPHQPGSGHPI